MKKTTSNELANKIAQQTGLYLNDVRTVLQSLDDVVRSEVIAGEIVHLTGLGTLRLVKRPATRKFIPGQGMVRSINERYDVVFNPSIVFELAYLDLPNVPVGNEGDDAPVVVRITEKP